MSRRPQNPRFPPPIWPRRVVAPRDGGGGAGEAVRFLKVKSRLLPSANSPSSPDFQAHTAQKRAVAPTEQSLHGFRSRPRSEQCQFEVPKRDSGVPIPCRTQRSLRARPFRHPTSPHFASQRPKFRPRKSGPVSLSVADYVTRWPREGRATQRRQRRARRDRSPSLRPYEMTTNFACSHFWSQIKAI